MLSARDVPKSLFREVRGQGSAPVFSGDMVAVRARLDRARLAERAILFAADTERRSAFEADNSALAVMLHTSQAVARSLEAEVEGFTVHGRALPDDGRLDPLEVHMVECACTSSEASTRPFGLWRTDLSAA